MQYEKPELTLVDLASVIVLGDEFGSGDSGTAPFQLTPVGFAMGLDE
jgi:hypothetical protein